MIVFTRSYLIRTDSRLHRYFRALARRGLAWHAVAWDRTGVEPDTAEVTYYHKQAPIGGGMRNLVGILRWNWFCFRALMRARSKVSLVHAVDLDGALGAFAFAKLFRKKFVFDAFDKYSDTRNMPTWLARISDSLETFCMRHADRVLLPDDCRIQQHGVASWDHVSVIENVPGDTEETQFFRLHPNQKADGEPIQLAYVGTLEPEHRGIEDLLVAVEQMAGRITLSIAGTGPLETLCRERASKYPQLVQFHGQVAPDEALRLMGKADVVVGMYYRSSRNHLFAAPNKYFEHLMLGKALITTVGTPPGEKVVARGTGWALPEGLHAIRALLEQLDSQEVFECGRRAAALWEREYADYFQRVLVEQYGDMVSALARR